MRWSACIAPMEELTEVLCSSVLDFVETRNLTFIKIQLTNCSMMLDLGVGNLDTD